MSFRILEVKSEYRSFQDNVVEDFYIPVLEKAIRYDRAVGYFSSTSISDITKGIIGLVKNNGKIRIITSPRLSEEDIEAIKFGYKKREEIINNSFSNVFEEPLNEFQKRRLNLLATLISRGIIEIKIALIDDGNTIGMFHEKMGIIEDFEGNKIAFTGSLNETTNAFNHNYESIDLYKSWTYELERVQSKEKAFEDIWNNRAKNIITLTLPEITLDKLKEYVQPDLDEDIDKDEYLKVELKEDLKDKVVFPNEIELRDYQVEAIDKWEQNNFRGIFDMATGTGKTLTGLAAAARLSEKLDHKIAIVIVCPYQHLVDQWVYDVKKLNLNPIIGHSSSPQKKWKEKFKRTVESYNLDIKKNFCLITTNASFSTPLIQNLLKTIDQNLLLIVDEAHNFGAAHLQKQLLKNAEYRLALSATIKRHNDEDGTQSLFDYFGKICLNYTLEMAIVNGMLTPYYYYPVVVALTESELQQYKELTAKIIKAFKKDKNGKLIPTEQAKMLLIQRARIVAGAENKIQELKKIIEKDYLNESQILIYCGATTINDPDYGKADAFQEEKRQIDVVTNLLGNILGMRVGRFTSEESALEREGIKELFSKGRELQALAAIRCLDEGVNIPSVKNAFILASSTNPKEYIQRRGRVLRLAPEKSHANIYDFITLPFDFKEIDQLTDEEIINVAGLAKREVHRMEDFASLAINSINAVNLIDQIKTVYKITNKKEELI